MDIKVKNLKKQYGNKIILDIEELNLTSGKIYGIIGPNGAGKSTLLKIISGLEEPTEGKVYIDGERLDDLKMKHITYSNQKPYLYRTTVFNNVSYPLKFRKMNKENINSTVNDILHEFKIEHIKDNQAISLSGGETQKVALARALVFDPKCLLLDEPTANIDPDYVEIIEKAVIDRNKKNNSTVLIITHNISQARRICDEIIFLNNGKIVEVGNMKEIFLNSNSNIIRKFLDIEYCALEKL
ncbi:ABC transporter ATP-binding protein [Oceanirhabdus sp. W0125-5]|uniref:ABC transporter ATP-binding protein n=1 Tax=Oceanirhabdus sp. W0125-5 TaxID=2999116 RepID=UPI0022F34085|nr:ABC transporter ATP-binding protein [Oceanirhabdus sp. W0125-5]WBW99502.1 ABC transporter ATP-binding protein [Oceanirhabdus sp. W0125-5]